MSTLSPIQNIPQLNVQVFNLIGQANYTEALTVNETVRKLSYKLIQEKPWRYGSPDLKSSIADEYLKSLNNQAVILNKQSEELFNQGNYDEAEKNISTIKKMEKRCSQFSLTDILYKSSLKHQCALALNLQAKISNKKEKYKEAKKIAKEAEQMAQNALLLNQSELEAGLLFQEANALFNQGEYEQAIIKAQAASEEAKQTLKTTSDGENYKANVAKIIALSSKLHEEALLNLDLLELVSSNTDTESDYFSTDESDSEKQDILELVIGLNKKADELDNRGNYEEMLGKAKEAELTVKQILPIEGEDPSITIQLAYALYYQSHALSNLFYQYFKNDSNHASKSLDIAIKKAKEGLALKTSDEGIQNLLKEQITVCNAIKQQVHLDTIGKQISNGDGKNTISLLLDSMKKA